MTHKTKPTPDFLEKIAYASWESQDGDPMKDFLDAEDMEKAVHMLADILVATGVKLLDELP